MNDRPETIDRHSRATPGRHAVNGYLLALLATFIAPSSVSAADYPARPIRFVVPFAAGGTSDIIGRILSVRMQESLGQPLVVDNRGGAGGSIGTNIVAKADPDGYSIVLASNGTHAIVPHLYARLPYDPIKDFAPVSMVAITPTVLAVNPDLPAKSVKELIALAKAKPGLAFGSSGVGSTSHLSGELLATMADIRLTHVPYKSASAAYPDIFSGRVPLIFDTALSMSQHIKVNRVRALAVTTPKRALNMPDLPTMSEAGLPGYAITLWIAIYAPAATQPAVVARLNKAIHHALSLPEVREQMALNGAEVSYGSPADLLAATQSDLKRMGDIVKAAKIEAQ
jgi:tripartite-type tricarboxylate transporter receptor subunit TctC